ncbi:MAG: alpha/beta hydrolase [Deltaproteobacteria bacterium]|nr:alpha/beta hydrolase [Deltaproteobacteria bacterium]
MNDRKNPKGRILVWLKRLVIGSVLLLLLILLGGYTFQAYTDSRTERLYPPPGQLVDIGGYRMHYQRSRTGSPVVVLDSGLAGGGFDWANIQPEVAKFTCVISYDRAGLWWSDRGPKERTSRQIVKELHALLKQAEIPGPYVLVGASFGGYNVRLFTDEYPDQVAGLVLVDSVIDLLQNDNIPESIRRSNKNLIELAEVGYFFAPFGVGHLIMPGLLGDLPAEIKDLYLAQSCKTSNFQTSCAEWLNLNISTSQMKGCRLPPDIPLAILSASRSPNPDAPAEDQLIYLNIFHEEHEAIARQSANSYHYIVPDSGHAIASEKPDAVIDSIRRVVGAVRTNTKLMPPESIN